MSDFEYSDEFKNRFFALIGMIGNVKKASEIAGVTHDQIARWRDGLARPAFFPMAKLCAAANVSVDWLLTGREWKNSAPIVQQDPDVVLIPMLNVIASAGHGSNNGHIEIISKLPFSRKILRDMGVNADYVEFIQLKGDSMSPTISDGATVLVDRSKKDLRGDEIYVVSLGDEVRIKRVQKGIDRSITLISDNEKFYPPERLSSADAEQLRVHGRVFWTEKLL